MIKVWILFLTIHPNSYAGGPVTINNLPTRQECERVLSHVKSAYPWDARGVCIEYWQVRP